jgi:carbamoyltransferase
MNADNHIHTSASSPKNRTILGLHYGHDSTVVCIEDGEIVEAMSEERLSRVKKHTGFPHRSLKYIQEKYHIPHIKRVYVVGENPAWDSGIFVTEEENRKGRLVDINQGYKDYGRSLQFYIPGLHDILNFYYKVKEKFVFSGIAEEVTAYLANEFPGGEVVRLNHHMAHAWATIPFMDNKDLEYLIFTLDGAGDTISGSVNIWKDGTITRLTTVPFDSSIGLLYNAIVNILGMKPGEHEFKVMGLAPYAKASSGEEVYKKLQELLWFDKESMNIKTSIPTSKATSYFIAHNYHRYRFDSLAYGIQKLTEECIKDLVLAYVAKYNIHNVALGGGVFMNVKANQALLNLKEIDTLTIAPSCGDESLALGAAVYGYVHEGNDLKNLKPIKNLYLGSTYSDEDIAKAINDYAFTRKVTTRHFPDKENSIEAKVAELLANNHVVGRLKNRAEWGARALGNRSILANASSRDNIKLINEMIKGRDFWMPFATSLLHEDQHEYLHNHRNFFAPYMSITFDTKPKAVKEIAAALHPYDLTSRPQMVTLEMNPDYHKLLTEFKKLTGSSGILNTSFNLHGEPNVENPYDALRTFDISGLEHVAIGNYLVSKVPK